jgi:hypothetical protein
MKILFLCDLLKILKQYLSKAFASLIPADVYRDICYPAIAAAGIKYI